MIRLKNCGNMYTPYGLCFLNKNNVAAESSWFETGFLHRLLHVSGNKTFVLDILLTKACTYNGFKFWGGSEGAFLPSNHLGSVFRTEGELIMRAKFWV